MRESEKMIYQIREMGDRMLDLKITFILKENQDKVDALQEIYDALNKTRELIEENQDKIDVILEIYDSLNKIQELIAEHHKLINFQPRIRKEDKE